MMREIGKVCEIKGNKVKVSVVRKSACGENCANCSGGCVPTKTVISAESSFNVKPGDMVVMEMPDNYALLAAFIAYVIPLFFGLLSAGAVYAAKMQDIFCVAGMFIGLGAGFVFSRILSRKFSDKLKVRITSAFSGVNKDGAK